MSSQINTPLPTRLQRISRPFQIFARHQTAGAIVLLVASALALVWANSPWSGSYFAILRATVAVRLGEIELAKPLLLWINDGLMGFFFFVIGLELKRELIAGELSSPRKAALPFAAALGGMVVPVAIYLVINRGGPGEHGWGGIGFTMSLFVAGLAFANPALHSAAKAAILVASAIASLFGVGLFLLAERSTPGVAIVEAKP